MTDPTTTWLLEDENPAIAYRTRTELLGEPASGLAALYDSIWQTKKVAAMLAKRDADGLFDSERKYYGMFTNLRYLTAFAEFGLHKDARLDALAEQTAAQLGESADKGDLSGCASPLVLRALVMLGYQTEPVIAELIEKFAAGQLADGGFMCRRLLDRRPDRKSCYKAALNALLLYAECAKKGVLPANADKLVEYFTGRDVFYSSDKTKKLYEEAGRFGWRIVDNFFPVEPMRVGLPLIMSALAILGAGNHPALSEAWQMLGAKKNAGGRYALDGTLTKQPCSFGKAGEENKWITFYVMMARGLDAFTFSEKK